jgi:periplasmic protein TonB
MEPKKHPSKDVHRHSKHFFLIGLCISIALVITAFEWRSKKKNLQPQPRVLEEQPFSIYPIPVTVHETKPEVKPVKEKSTMLDPTRIVVDENILDEPTTEFPVEELGKPIQFDFGETKEIPVDTFIVVERMPEPVGGLANFYKQISASLKYPSKAVRYNKEGKVFVEFVIDQQGNPVKIKVTRGLGYGCDEEAMRVLSLTKWTPGNQRGHAVPVKMTMAMNFKLDKRD